jgi:hypothetical protein
MPSPPFIRHDNDIAPPEGQLLIVDDEEGSRDSLRVIFWRRAFILLVADGATAIKLAQNWWTPRC